MTKAGRFATLSRFLEEDPDNIRLLVDAAEAALDEGELQAAAELLARHERIAPLSIEARHLSAVIAMQAQDWSHAAEALASLRADGVDAPPLRFNLAWSLSMQQHFDAALELLDESTGEALPQAAELEIQLLHQLGHLDAATARAHQYVARHPEHRGLNAAISVLALDIEDSELAARCARAAGDHPDALTSIGTLALENDDPASAGELFDAALARNPGSPRALIGRGLVRLLANEAAAANDLDRGAEIFGTHLGSWIAAGWAYVIAGDTGAGRQRFGRALAIDDNFAEAHGSLAVVELLSGDMDAARQRTEVALRLDRQCFSGALAATLLAAGSGEQARAEMIFRRALETPIDASGRTIAASLVRLGIGTA
ncbi:tetratricopeptide repeat protein [Sphingosinithalassobacter portus]|uniref:tetratricopeptide repeat protein n=1 Tax=Stakelama portus TaxID=2676234 RepID=UPI000D6DFB01|nr:tetratricopeptide repeat protein [Sphingosinithalassobacter portus]